MRVAKLVVGLVLCPLLPLLGLAACTQSVDDGAHGQESHQDLLFGSGPNPALGDNAQCGAWNAWAGNAPVTGVLAKIESRVSTHDALPACPTVYVGRKAYAPYDAAIEMFNEYQCRPFGTNVACETNMSVVGRVEWGSLWPSMPMIRGQYCDYEVGGSNDPQALADLQAAVRVQVPGALSSYGRSVYDVTFFDVHRPALTLLCNNPGGHVCPSCAAN